MPVLWTVRYAGDTTLVIEFGDRIDRGIFDRVNALDALVHSAINTGDIDGIRETIPTFRSLAIVYDSSVVHPDDLVVRLHDLETEDVDGMLPETHANHWQLPVLYGTEHGPDLTNVSRLTGMSAEAVIDLHTSTDVIAYMLGFLPGYAFLGDTAEPLHLPRRSEPRLRVPAGSVAIAMQLTGIYPWESPGGWHILGNCPVPMFDATASPPTLLKAGDRISFTRIDEPQFMELKQELADSPLDRQRWLAGQ